MDPEEGVTAGECCHCKHMCAVQPTACTLCSVLLPEPCLCGFESLERLCSCIPKDGVAAGECCQGHTCMRHVVYSTRGGNQTQGRMIKVECVHLSCFSKAAVGPVVLYLSAFVPTCTDSTTCVSVLCCCSQGLLL